MVIHGDYALPIHFPEGTLTRGRRPLMPTTGAKHPGSWRVTMSVATSHRRSW